MTAGSSAPRRCPSLGAVWALVAGLLLLLMPVALPSVRADDLDDGVRRIAKQLRCPICESVSVADSPADLAIQMRALIRRKLEAGERDQQILDYFVGAYGDSVLLEPPRRGLGLIVWLGPVVAVAAGAVLLALVLRVWVRSRDRLAVDPLAAVTSAPVPRGVSPTSSPDATARARLELEAIRDGKLG